jgi:hypothetical protein
VNSRLGEDLSLDQDGNCVGSMEMGAGGGSVEIVKQGDEVWMKPDAAFWKAQVPGGQGDAVAELFKNLPHSRLRSSGGTPIIHGSTNDAMLKGMADTCDLNSFQQEVDTGSSDAGKLSKGDGTDMTLSFSDYGKPVPSKTPPADETVDVGKLQDELQSI